MDKKLKAVRKKLLTDFPFYSKAALKIRTKEGDIAPLKLNPAQQILQDAVDKQMAEEGKVRIIILKARQQGLSTYVGGYLYHKVSQNPAQRAMVIAHTSDSTKSLFDMSQRMHQNCPEILKPHTKYSNRRELTFDVLDSSYVVATAGGDSVGRGQTLQYIHASEMAFWPRASAEDIWNGLAQAVPSSQNTAVFIESTANGISNNLFYRLWEGAKEGTNGFTPVFVPWFLDPTYRESVPDNFERTPEEEQLVSRYGLDDEQLCFRRKRIAQSGRELFLQEYPSNDTECFLSTGRPVFNPVQLNANLDEARDIEEKLALEGDEWVHHHRGELTTYRPYDPGERYIVGADTSMGVSGDFSVAQVLDSKKRQVAVWRGQAHPDWFASVLYALGMFYNEAFIIVENNNHGILTCTRLGKDMAYPAFYYETTVDKLTDKESIKLGFTTTSKTKPLVIDQLRAAYRDGEIELNCKTTIREMLSFIVTETGSMEAEAGCHDDCVMALALANHVHEGAWEPVEQPDGIYMEMI